MCKGDITGDGSHQNNQERTHSNKAAGRSRRDQLRTQPLRFGRLKSRQQHKSSALQVNATVPFVDPDLGDGSLKGQLIILGILVPLTAIPSDITVAWLGAKLTQRVSQCPAIGVEALEQGAGQLMLLEKGHCLQRHALAAYPGRIQEEVDDFAATSLTTLIAMVSEGLGITLLPDLSVRAGLASDGSVRLTPLPDAWPRQVVLAWREGSPQTVVFERLCHCTLINQNCA